MFERFTEKAIKVIMLSQELPPGSQLRRKEQLLLGLLEKRRAAAKVLKSMGVNLKDVRIEVEKSWGSVLVPWKFPYPTGSGC